MKYSKIPLDYNQQIEILKERGLLIADEKETIAHLKVISYFRLANYLRPMELDKEIICTSPTVILKMPLTFTILSCLFPEFFYQLSDNGSTYKYTMNCITIIYELLNLAQKTPFSTLHPIHRHSPYQTHTYYTLVKRVLHLSKSTLHRN